MQRGKNTVKVFLYLLLVSTCNPVLISSVLIRKYNVCYLVFFLNRVQLWDLEDGKLLTTREGHKRDVWDVAVTECEPPSPPLPCFPYFSSSSSSLPLLLLLPRPSLPYFPHPSAPTKLSKSLQCGSFHSPPPVCRSLFVSLQVNSIPPSSHGLSLSHSLSLSSGPLHLIVSVSEDRTVRIWDINTTVSDKKWARRRYFRCSDALILLLFPVTHSRTGFATSTCLHVAYY